jgi:hypothetical protein
LNNNRGNNRRRGRGNNNRPQNGGGQQINRIDSRARGNAPQMLEKYRKMAQDAHLNGDRVQAEYYLQFADHYFRVVADTRVRQEEQQRQRQNGGGQPYVAGYAAGGSVSGDNWQDQDGEDDSMEFGIDRDFPTFDRAPAPRRDDSERREPREQRDYREPRDQRESRQRAPEPIVAEAVPPEGLRVVEGEPITPASDNPFVRDARPPRGRNNDRRPGRRADGEAPRPQRNFAETQVEPAEPAPRFDPSSLPPSIATRSDAVDEAPVRAERSRTLRAATAPAPAPVAVAVIVDEVPVAAPKKRGRPRKNPLPVAED